MITRQERQMLSKLCKLTDYTEARFTHFSGETEFFLLDDPSVKIDLSTYSNEIIGLLSLLEHEGYIISDAAGSESMLTPKGIHYEYIRWTEFKVFLLKHILTPVIVSAITSAVTTLVTLYFNGIIS